MIVQLLAFTLIGSTTVGTSPAKVEVNASIKDGDVITGEAHFKITVQSESPVTQVEFYVGDDLRDTDSSTPYEFKLDTLVENEGAIKLTFAAYTSDGESAKKIVTANIDNGLSKGVDFHVQKAMDFVVLSKFEEAIQEGRIALKIKPDSNPARIIMARAYLGKGVLDTAQKFADDAVQSQPDNFEARDLLTGINLKRAFTVINRSGDKKESLDTITSALKNAVKTRKETLERQIDIMGTVTDANLVKYADLCIKAGRYSAAYNALAPAFRKDEKNTALANRLVYSYLRAGRNEDAMITLQIYSKRGQMDAYGYALLAVYDAMTAQNAASDQAIKEAILNDGSNVGVKTAQAYIALRRGKTEVLRQIAQDLRVDDGQLPEVNFYNACANQVLGNYDEAEKRYQQAVFAEPIYFDVYVQKGCDTLVFVMKKKIDLKDPKELQFQYDTAKMYFETALIAKPESPEALTGLAITYGLQKKQSEFLKYARAAVMAGPSYAAAHYTLCVALNGEDTLIRSAAMKAEREGNRDEAKRLSTMAEMLNDDTLATKKRAGLLDPQFLANIASIPKIEEAYAYFIRYGKLPLLAPPSQ